MPALGEAIAHAQAEADLRAALDRTLRELTKAKATRAELVAAVYAAAKDAASSLRIPPVPKAPPDKRTARSGEVAICLLADWQLGKRTPSYDSDVAEARVRRYAEKVVRLIDLQRSHHPVREARIYLLGDLVEGEEIFPGQAHHIDASLYVQLFRCAGLIAEVVRTIAAHVETVRVVGVIGNHGRLGYGRKSTYHPESNVDAIAYNVARGMVPGVEWPETLTSGERAWYAIDEVLGRSWLLFHGDQIRSASYGIPWYGYQKRLLGWATALEPFTYAASGHWHVPIRQSYNAITHWGAGSTESGNTYAQEWLASGAQEPSQWLLFQGHDGISAEYLVRLG